MRPTGSKSRFVRFAKAVARWSGKPAAFLTALGLIALWAATGPLFGFSNRWQLVVNTGTTIVTFLMVFLIQNTQNRDGEAIQVKLDELIRVSGRGHNALLDLEELSDEELDAILESYREIARHARAELRRGRTDTNVAPVGTNKRGRRPQS